MFEAAAAPLMSHSILKRARKLPPLRPLFVPFKLLERLHTGVITSIIGLLFVFVWKSLLTSRKPIASPLKCARVCVYVRVRVRVRVCVVAQGHAHAAL